jgi:hypothetical protein
VKQAYLEKYILRSINMTQGLPEKSKLSQHAYEEDHKICWKGAKVTAHTGNAKKQPIWFWRVI